MRVFYSWQSDLAGSTNRNFILRALEDAAERIRNDESVELEPVIDRDTQGLSGSPDIKAAILDKIDSCDVFVADVSLITLPSSPRPCPNPNVLFELGYAVKYLSFDFVIIVLNTAFGVPEDLPFDLRNHRVLTYEVNEADSEKASSRKLLSKSLEEALRATILSIKAKHSSQAREALTEHAIRVLLEATKALSPNVLSVGTKDQYQLVIDGRNLAENSDSREVAFFKEAVEQLSDQNLLRPLKPGGSVYEVTAEGFRVAEKLALPTDSHPPSRDWTNSLTGYRKTFPSAGCFLSIACLPGKEATIAWHDFRRIVVEKRLMLNNDIYGWPILSSTDKLKWSPKSGVLVPISPDYFWEIHKNGSVLFCSNRICFEDTSQPRVGIKTITYQLLLSVTYGSVIADAFAISKTQGRIAAQLHRANGHILRLEQQSHQTEWPVCTDDNPEAVVSFEFVPSGDKILLVAAKIVYELQSFFPNPYDGSSLCRLEQLEDISRQTQASNKLDRYYSSST